VNRQPAPPKATRRFVRWLAPATVPTRPIRIYGPRWLTCILAAAGVKESQ